MTEAEPELLDDDPWSPVDRNPKYRGEVTTLAGFSFAVRRLLRELSRSGGTSSAGKFNKHAIDEASAAGLVRAYGNSVQISDTGRRLMPSEFNSQWPIVDLIKDLLAN